MRYHNVTIDAVEYELPAESITSQDLENALSPVYERLNLPFGRLELMSGIRERRFWPKGFKPSDAATLAGRKALERTGLPKDRIQCLMMCSVCRDFLEPATAAVVHHNLGMSSACQIFDISNACLGVLNGIFILANMIELNQIEAGMLVAGENSRDLVETTIDTILRDSSIDRQTIKPFFASLTIGSGAVAVVMSRRGSCGTSSHQLLGGVCFSNTAYNDLCRGNNLNQQQVLMHTESENLMHEGVAVAKETWKRFEQELGWQDNDVDCYCTHQVGSAHRKLLFEELGLNVSKNFSTLESTGNVGSVSCPLTVAMAAEQRFLNTDSNLAMLGIGSGITCAMLGVRW